MTPKELNVKKLALAAPQAAEVPAALAMARVVYQPVACVDWKEAYPYAPKVEFAMAYTDDALLLHYRVTEASVRAMAGRDNGPVWEDACVEFFSMPGGDDVYYNIECNCAGTLLIGAGSARSNRQHASQVILDQVSRWSSLGRESFDERVGECSWEVALVVPFTAFFLHDIHSMDGKSVKGNFYKCGDKLQTPHFLSWSPIELPKPDFHCPSFFGTLHFE